MSERTYSEREIAALLQRAMERREAERGRGAPLASPADEPGRGLTLAEIQHAAAEVGLDARYLDEAAREMALGGGTRVHAGPWADRVEVERVVAAAPSEAAWDAIEADLRRRMGTMGGETRRYPGGWEWSHTDDEGKTLLRATLTDLGGASKLRLTRASIGPPTAALVGAGIGGVLSFMISAASGAPGIVMLVAFVLLGAAAGFFGSGALRRAKAVNLQRLAEAADAHLHAAAAAAPRPATPAHAVPAAVSPEAARLDLDALGDEASGGTQTTAHRTRS